MFLIEKLVQNLKLFVVQFVHSRTYDDQALKAPHLILLCAFQYIETFPNGKFGISFKPAISNVMWSEGENTDDHRNSVFHSCEWFVENLLFFSSLNRLRNVSPFLIYMKRKKIVAATFTWDPVIFVGNRKLILQYIIYACFGCRIA